MNKLFSVIMTIAILSGAYAGTLALTGNEPLAQTVTISMGAFSALMYLGKAYTSNFIFEVVVIPDFEAKSKEDTDKMTLEEYGDYLKEKKEYETALMKKEIQDQMTEALKDSEDSKLIKELQDKFNLLVKEHEVSMLTIKKLSETEKETGDEKSDLMKFIERDRDEEIEKGSGFKSIAVKVAALMTTANVIPNVASGFNQLFGNFIDPTIHSAPKPDNYILPLVNIIPAAGTENIWFVDRINEEGTAQFIAEGALKPLADGEWQESKADIKEVAVRWKMSNRLIKHAPSVVADFRRHVDELMDQVIDDGVAAGDGLGNNLTGISTAAAPFVVPPALALFYQNPNIFDVICAVAVYVRLNNFKGSLTAVLNTVWTAKMKALKNVDDDYIMPPFVSPDGTQVGEVTVKFTNKIADTDILLGELKRFNVVISEDVMFFEGWENDDFSKNLSSKKLEAFMGTYLPTSDAGAIIFDDIATIQLAIAAL